MDASVNVLAVMDDLAKRADMKLPQGIASHVVNARDAVRELIEAANGPLCHPDFETRTKANVRLAHALIRAEGRTP